MAESPSIVIAGAGSIGCYVGGCLLLGGRDVTFLARPAITATLKSGGLQVTDLEGSIVRARQGGCMSPTTATALQNAAIILVTVERCDAGDGATYRRIRAAGRDDLERKMASAMCRGFRR